MISETSCDVIQWYVHWIYEIKKTDTYIHLTEQTQRHIEYSGISWSERWRAVPVYLSFPNRIILTTQTFPRKKYLVRRGWTNHESMEILMTNSWSEFRFKNRDKKETHKNWHFIIVCLSIMSRIVFPILLANLKSDTVDCFLFLSFINQEYYELKEFGSLRFFYSSWFDNGSWCMMIWAYYSRDSHS